MRAAMMTNPAQLLLAGNPRSSKKSKRRRRKHHTNKAHAAPSEKPMSSTKHRRKRSRHARIAKHRARRAKRRSHRKGKMPAGLAAYWAGKRGKAKANPKRRRRSHKARMHTKRSRRRHRRRAHANPGLFGLMAPTKHKRRRGRKHRAHHRRRRHAKRNPGVKSFALKLFTGFTHLGENLKDTFVRGGIKGFAAAAAGAGGAVFAGTLVSRVTSQAVGMVAPSALANPMVSRLLGAGNYYLAGFLLSKYLPGISPRVRRGMLTGATVAAIIEAIKPGVVRETAMRVPFVGSVFGRSLSGLADGMGDYVAFALNGLSGNGSDRAAMQYVEDEDDGSNADSGMSDYVTGVPPVVRGLNDYVTFAR